MGLDEVRHSGPGVIGLRLELVLLAVEKAVRGVRLDGDLVLDARAGQGVPDELDEALAALSPRVSNTTAGDVPPAGSPSARDPTRRRPTRCT